MAHQLAPRLWQLEVPLPGNPLKTLNSYLLTGERNLLIDTGFRQDACREALLAQLAELQVRLEETDIFLTHHHTDHSGLVTELHRPGCRIYIGAIDAPLLDAALDPVHWDWLFADYLRSGFPQEELHRIWGENPAKNLGPIGLPQVTTLAHGDTLRYGGRTLETLLTPGHTPGHLCLYERTEKLLFCGDHVLFHITPNIARWETVADSLGDYLESLRDIRELPVDLLCPAHRLVEGELRRRCDQLLAHHAQRVEDALATVRRHPGLTAYDIAGQMRWEIRSRSWEDFPGAQKWFAVGEALSHLDYLEKRGLVESREEAGLIRYHNTRRS